jgi:hypothetical protein
MNANFLVGIGAGTNVTVDNTNPRFPVVSAAGGGGGVTTMANIGAAPNAAGASISGNTLTLQPANASFGGVLTNTTQTIAGEKTFTDSIVFSNMTPITWGTNSGSPALVLFRSISETYGWGLTSGQMNFFMPSNVSYNYRWRNGSSMSGTSLMSLNASTGHLELTTGSYTINMANNLSRPIIRLNTQSGLAYRGGELDLYNWSDRTINFHFTGAAPTLQTTSYLSVRSTGLSINNSGAFTASARMEVGGTNGGVLHPRMTTTQRDAIASPANMLQVSNTTRQNHSTYLTGTGASWVEHYGSKYTLATDANTTFGAITSHITLPDITANRTLTLPAAATYVAKTLIIKNANSAGFAWSVSPAIKTATDSDLTALANDSVYTIFSDGTNWLIISIYQ